ncbi:cytochrome c3 family protein [Thermodesulfatator atlanticus]|uniref:cytochrome c3 family protein n=1 Tax=Thermodesulfatator atlanticus TaxID=501497 RepID=UPI0003B63578|nr:cytochrome c3 family protein [Thermodesulfatator atlanticus]
MKHNSNLLRAGLGIIILLVFPYVVNAAVQIEIFSPPNKVWVTEKRIFLAGTVSGEVKKIEIKGVKVVSPRGKIIPDAGAFGAIIELKKGLNRLKISADGVSIKYEIFYLSPKEQKKGMKPPKGFKHFFVHKDPELISCKECHSFRRGKYNFKRNVPAQANCTTGNCHATQGKAPFVHGPVGAKVCIACHSPHGSFNELELSKTGQDLCFSCHQAKKEEFAKEIVHVPVEEGCIDCHDPHQSNMRFQLKGDGKTISSLCFNCHEKEMFTQKHMHGPVATGDCIACHSPHASDYKALLMAPPEKGQVCFECHQDRKEDFTMKFVHDPAQEDCSQCHDPHSSPYRFQLIKQKEKLCATCHQELTPEIFTAMNEKYPHKPVKNGDCVACHRPHSSNYELLLANDLTTLCFNCHVDLGDYIKESKFKHGPVQTGDCIACHNVHGSQYVSLLVKYFPPKFYIDYKPENYDLCFACHNKDIARNKLTNVLTNFRDGEFNLHYLHVHRKKGRTCIACHDPHASNQAKHIRYEVPFGAWAYPISFKKTPTGGTCIVGCHAPKSYDRLRPVFWKPPTQ